MMAAAGIAIAERRSELDRYDFNPLVHDQFDRE
jgi:hypothetical protein